MVSIDRDFWTTDPDFLPRARFPEATGMIKILSGMIVVSV
jgi:hypothetical protein